MNSNKKDKRSNKWRQWRIGIGVLLILVAILLYSLSNSNVSGDMVIATVNGYDITYDEFMQYASKHRANIRAYFMQQYEVVDSKDFWQKSFNGEIPIEKLRQATMEELIRVKVEQSEMVTLGIAKDVEYATLLKELQQENEDRLNALEAGKIIYGPKQYTLRAYIDYIHEERRISFIEKLKDTYLILSDEEALLFYNQHKDQFKNQDVIKVEALKVVKKSNKVELINKTLQVLINSVNEGLSFDAILEKYRDQDAVSIVKENYLLDQNTSNEKDTNLSTLQWYANEMATGEISEIILVNDVYYFIKVVDKKDGGYMMYEEVTQYIQSALLRQKYKAYIESKIEEAVLEVNEKNLSQIN